MSTPAPSRKRILIVGVNWLGDILLLTPAIRAIRRAHPDSFIAALVPPRGRELLEGNPHLDHVLTYPESRGLRGILGWWPLVRLIRAGRFDTCFLFHPSFTRAAAVWAAGVKRRIGYRTFRRGWLLTRAIEPPDKDSIHKAAGYLRLVEMAGLKPDGLDYDVGILPEDRRAADTLLAELGLSPNDMLVALHAGANWKLKRWPARSFARLADALIEKQGAQVLLIGSREDLPLIEAVRAQMRGRPLVLAGRTTLRQLGAVLGRARLLISNDSGPLHLGLAVGVPVVGLFGPTVPKLTGPPNGSNAKTLFGSIGCPVPCYQLRCPVNLCMEQITVEQVLAAAERFLK